MKLIEILEEEDTFAVGEEKLNEILKDKNISECLKHYEKNEVFCRYTKAHDELIYQVRKENHPNKRTPTGTSKKSAEIINNFRKKYFPHIADRLHSVFCWAAKIEDAFNHLYTAKYFIFPTNKSKLFQSPEVSDIYGDSIYIDALQPYVNAKDPYTRRHYKEKTLKGLKDYFSEGITKWNEIFFVARHGPHEIYFEYDYYYAIKIDFIWELKEKYKKESHNIFSFLIEKSKN